MNDETAQTPFIFKSAKPAADPGLEAAQQGRADPVEPTRKRRQRAAAAPAPKKTRKPRQKREDQSLPFIKAMLALKSKDQERVLEALNRIFG